MTANDEGAGKGKGEERKPKKKKRKKRKKDGKPEYPSAQIPDTPDEKETYDPDYFRALGVDGGSGRVLRPVSAREVAWVARYGSAPPPEPGAGPGGVLEPEPPPGARGMRRPGARGTIDPADYRDLSLTGWGVIFAPDTPAAVREALDPLLAHRREQATARDGRYFKQLTWEKGWTHLDFLDAHGAAPGPVDPRHLPYYLLLVGDPREVPYAFQHQLDVQHAVGRLDFDRADDYARYAAGLLAAEARETPRGGQAAFVGVTNPDEYLSERCAAHLVEPLAEELLARPGWVGRTVLREEATKERLARLLGGGETPDLLFTAGHGLLLGPRDPRQIRHQGALVCRDWPGPIAWNKSLLEKHYFSADDVAGDARLDGTITFHFGCYTAGTLRRDSFDHHRKGATWTVAARDFVARLPRRLLAHPRGGALAVVGHVDRAWEHSFASRGGEARRTAFRVALERLMDGYPVGWAMEVFNQRHASLAAELSAHLDGLEQRDAGMEGMSPAELTELADLWTMHNDARGYAVFGDPAARFGWAGAGGGAGGAR